MALEQVTLMRRSCLAIVLLLMCVPAWGATYYVDATAGNDSNTGIATNIPWKTISKVNASSFMPGDQILFRRSEMWREKLVVSSSGSNTGQIIFGSYGQGSAPVISGANVVTEWTSYAGTIYQATLAAQPYAVWDDGNRLTEKSSPAEMTEGSWYWLNNNKSLLIWTKGGLDPRTKSIEVGERDACVAIFGKNYITIDGLALTKNNSYWMGVVHFDGQSGGGIHLTLQNCVITSPQTNAVTLYSVDYASVIANTLTGDGFGQGINPNQGQGHADSHLLIHNNTISGFTHGISSPISGVLHVTQATISQNTIHDLTGNGMGINKWSDLIIENNRVYNITSSQDISGIHTADSPNCLIRYNIVYDVKDVNGIGGHGIQLDTNSDNSEVYYNISYNNGGTGISVIDSQGISLYNNTCYANGKICSVDGGISLQSPVLGKTSGTVKNNLVYIEAPNPICIYIDTKTSLNPIDINSNCWYKTSSHWWKWGDTLGLAVDQWNGHNGVGTDIYSDPMLMNPAQNIFALQESSPCRGTGTNVSLGRDINGTLVPQNGKPDIGAVQYQPVPPVHPQLPVPPSNIHIL